MTVCKYLDGAVAAPGSTLEALPCVIRDGVGLASYQDDDDGSQRCIGCDRDGEQMGGDWPADD